MTERPNVSGLQRIVMAVIDKSDHHSN